MVRDSLDWRSRARNDLGGRGTQEERTKIKSAEALDIFQCVPEEASCRILITHREDTNAHMHFHAKAFRTTNLHWLLDTR